MQNPILAKSARKLRVFAIAMLALATVSPALATTYIEDLYTLSGDSEGGTFGNAQASGTFGVIYYSNGKDRLFSTLQVNEDVGGVNYDYSFAYNCISTVPNCGTPTVPSQIPGLSAIDVSLSIDTFAFTAPTSVVPTSFTDAIYDYSGQGTLTEQILTSSVPEPATWATLLLGFFGVGAMVRYGRSRARALA